MFKAATEPVGDGHQARPTANCCDRLPLPDAVEPGHILWGYVTPIALLHGLALMALVPWLFSWTGLIVMLVGVHLYGQSINVCYHRLLAHRSFKVPSWLERFFVIVALCCMQDTPGKWVAMHRFHHTHSDEQQDPHSPLVNFLWAHIGWLVIRNPTARHIATYRKYARDVLEDPFYMRLEKQPWLPFWIYAVHAGLYFVVGFGIGWATAGMWSEALRFGLSLLLWGAVVRTVVVWHITWSVNSLTHLFGYKSYQTGENSRNNWLVALVTVGEGWHNNHHYDPASASVQHRWWEIDVSYYEIKLLQWLGLATNVNQTKTNRRAVREAARQSV